MRVLPVLTEPSPSFTVLFCATRGRPVDAASARRVPGRRGCAHSAVPLGQSHSPGASRVPFGRRPGQRRDDGVGGGHSSVARCATGAEPVHSAVSPHSARPVHVPPPSAAGAGAATASGAGRRLLPTASASAPPRRRGLLPPCGFSHRARGKMALLWRTRDGTSTAARLRRGLLT